MKNIFLLEGDDIITENCFCRPLMLSYEHPQSDSIFFTSMGGTPKNNLKWCETKRILPAWIGATVKEFNNEVERYEFAVGDIPIDHIEPLTISEYTKIYYEYLNKSKIKNSRKYPDKSAMHVYQNDPDYFRWAESNGLIKSLETMHQEYLDKYGE